MPKRSRSAAPASSKTSCSRPRLPPRKWPPSSSSRCRAKADTWSRPPSSCRNCAASAIVTAFCWWSDEVQSGVGRTGKWWAIEHTGVQPDIVCSAKGIASGMPLGVTMSRAEIMDWVPGSHASTFGGNPVCIAAALATLDVIEKEGLLHNSAEVGNHMLKRMADWPAKPKLVGDVRGRGLMIGVEIVKDKRPRSMARRTRPHRRAGFRARHSVPGLRSEHDPHVPAAGRDQRRSRRRDGCARRVHPGGGQVVWARSARESLRFSDATLAEQGWLRHFQLFRG